MTPPTKSDQPPAGTATKLEAGREVRNLVPIESHAHWEAPSDRPDPVAILEKQAAEREQDLVPIRYGRMLESAFTFYRGGAAIMAWDLSKTPTTDLRVQACGDAHLLNFGIFAAPDRRLVFDLNDFDETLPASFEWDLKRLTASVAIGALDNGFSKSEAGSCVRRAVSTYSTVIAENSQMRFLDAWYARLDIDEVRKLVESSGDPKRMKTLDKTVTKAMSRDNVGALSRFADSTPLGYRIKEEAPVIMRIPVDQYPESAKWINQAFEDYVASMQPDRQMLIRRYKYCDFARKVVGVGSVGTAAFMLLLMGDRFDDPLFIQLKQAQESVLAPYAGASEFANHGQRVVEGQRIMQAASDSFLGWLQGIGPKKRHFYARQLRDMKGSANIAKMGPEQLEGYAGLCGRSLAHAHARSGDAARLSGYIGKGNKLGKALEKFSLAYAEQNALDYAKLLEAEASGRVQVERGV